MSFKEDFLKVLDDVCVMHPEDMSMAEEAFMKFMAWAEVPALLAFGVNVARMVEDD